jgi:hypothetical protein
MRRETAVILVLISACGCGYCGSGGGFCGGGYF